MSLRIVVSGLIGQHPQLGGMSWHYLQYVLGLRDLGHDVYYLEDSGEWPYNWDGGATGDDWVEHDAHRNVAYLASVMERFGLGDRWAYRVATDGTWHGLSDAARVRAIHAADLLVNVSGSIEHPDAYGSIGRRIYIDSDPVFTQLSIATTDHLRRTRVDAHDAWFTFAADLSTIPDDDYGWLSTHQPVVLDLWSTDIPPDPARYTTVMNWTSYSPLQFRGELYGQKDVEFVRFLDLPSAVPAVTLEIATPDHGHTEWERAPEDLGASVHDALTTHGWRVADSLRVAAGFDQYHQYVVGSRGEWSVAKHGYVRGNCGWFSERSACYLAAGRPVIAQDTGFSSWLPTGDGLVAFSDPDDAVAALEDVEARYPVHADAAREIAREYFAAPKVLGDLVERAGSTSPSG